MHKEGLEIYNKTFILLFCISIRQDKEIEIKLQFPLFLVTVLSNKLVILTILFLQCVDCNNM